jgi:hypothetical protein
MGLGVVRLSITPSGRATRNANIALLMLKNMSLLFLGFCLGAIITYAVLRHHSSKWMPLSKASLAYKNDAIFVNIPMPKIGPPTGQVKFVNRGTGKGEELGFLIKVKMDPLDQSKLPAKYKKSEEQPGGWTIGPTETVVYTSHIDFTLKDADGFVLFKTKSEEDPGTQWPMKVWSGQENTLQGFGQDSVPSGVIERTRAIEMQLVLDKCDNCRP